jgi:hypothetical protein
MKVEVNCKTYCVETLIADNERLRKDVIASAKSNRLVLDSVRAEIEALNPVDYVSMSSYEGHKGASDMKDDVLQIIDKYRGE